MKTTDAVRALVEDKITSMGYDLVDVEFKKEQTDWVLTFFIDQPEGITLEDCERVSREIDPILDEADPILQQYYLSVSSPGIDRPLKTERDYTRHLQKMITIKLYAAVEKKKEFTGSLLVFDENTLQLQGKDGKARVFERKDIAQAKPYIEFK